MLKQIGIVGELAGIEAKLESAAPGEVLVAKVGDGDAGKPFLSAVMTW